MSRSAIEQQDLDAIGLRDPDHAARDPRLRPVAVPAAGRLGRQIPLRADGLGERAASWMLDLFRRTRALRALSLPFAALIRLVSNLRIRVPRLRLYGEWPRAATAVAPGRCVSGLRSSSPAPAMPPGGSISYLSASLGLLGRAQRGPARLDHAAARRRADRPGHADLGADRRLDRAAAGLAERIQPLAQFLAAFPANLLSRFSWSSIVRFGLNPNIWLSPLMVLGTQWYILFNVIAGASAFPTDLSEAAGSFHLGGWRWWRKVILPGIFPYYVTGAITASGGSWNASIVAEVASWGNTI